MNHIAAENLLSFGLGKFRTILADPPWQFSNRTGKMAPEHKRLMRYATMKLQEIMELPISQLAQPDCHLYLWVPNALILEGLEVMKRWGFTYKTNLVWQKIRKDGGPDGRGVGFYFRNVTELVLFGIRGHMRTLAPGRTQVNVLCTRKREHSRKPDELYEIIEKCSPGPYLELFARHNKNGWNQWGNEVGNSSAIVYPQYRGENKEPVSQLTLLDSRKIYTAKHKPLLSSTKRHLITV
ncbi:MAG: S-adenosylmethionine-binding protein [Elusimicrobia bacterium]|nr:S-adenosylmethionine-binding protein [Candidatus Obscuribacterium magneticum]